MSARRDGIPMATQLAGKVWEASRRATKASNQKHKIKAHRDDQDIDEAQSVTRFSETVKGF